MNPEDKFLKELHDGQRERANDDKKEDESERESRERFVDGFINGNQELYDSQKNYLKQYVQLHKGPWNFMGDDYVVTWVGVERGQIKIEAESYGQAVDTFIELPEDIRK